MFVALNVAREKMPVQIEDFDASEMHTIVQNLSFPRLVGNPGEERAITYIKEKFAEVEIPLEIRTI